MKGMRGLKVLGGRNGIALILVVMVLSSMLLLGTALCTICGWTMTLQSITPMQARRR